MPATKVLEHEPGLVPAETIEADDQTNAPTHAHIADLAYSYWEARGGQDGSAWDDWFRAEEDLKRRREL